MVGLIRQDSRSQDAITKRRRGMERASGGCGTGPYRKRGTWVTFIHTPISSGTPHTLAITKCAELHWIEIYAQCFVFIPLALQTFLSHAQAAEDAANGHITARSDKLASAQVPQSAGPSVWPARAEGCCTCGRRWPSKYHQRRLCCLILDPTTKDEQTLAVRRRLALQTAYVYARSSVMNGGAFEHGVPACRWSFIWTST